MGDFLSAQTPLRLLAFDLGAESGRAMLGYFDGERLTIEELHRFSNSPVRVGAHLFTDVLRLWSEVQIGLQKAALQGGGDLASIGVDTWGVDFALLDRHDQLLNNPYHYRDTHTQGILEEVFQRIPCEEIYTQTGNQPIEFNTLFQLLALQSAADPVLAMAHSLLMLPDLFNFWLCGEKAAEFSIATTSQCYDLRRRRWALELCARLGLPTQLFQPVVPSGTQLGRLQPWLVKQSGCPPVPVVEPACHDTGSAVAAIPVGDERFMYVSSGTWSLVGVELPEPVINATALEANLTNEGGVGDRVRLLKITPGMWFLQQCRSEWARHGQSYSYAELTAQAKAAPAFGPLIAVGHPDFSAPGDLSARIQDYCRRTGQQIPVSVGEIVRCILESLALEYRACLEKLEAVLGETLAVIHIIGGGSRNELLNQLTADATRRPVVAGPVEATAAGNLLVQAMGLGHLASLEDLRAVVRASFAPQEFSPYGSEAWDQAFRQYCRLTASMRGGFHG